MRTRGDIKKQARPVRRRPQPQTRPEQRQVPQHSTFRRVAVFVPIEEPDRN
jgi:hypothetical protein